ncbi:MAG: AbrB/MazE/SpoVT family DNA-binding domain-containing protein [Acidobacteriota bacterium]
MLCHVSGLNQRITDRGRIVRLELEGDEALIRRDGDRLIIEPIRKQGLRATLASLPPIDVDFPDVDEGLSPLDDIEI